jgi:hypothetical protein
MLCMICLFYITLILLSEPLLFPLLMNHSNIFNILPDAAVLKLSLNLPLVEIDSEKNTSDEEGMSKISEYLFIKSKVTVFFPDSISDK